jgi:hypothetical protein
MLADHRNGRGLLVQAHTRALNQTGSEALALSPVPAKISRDDYRLHFSIMNAEKQAMLERILWGLPPVLLAWMLCFGLAVFALAALHD